MSVRSEALRALITRLVPYKVNFEMGSSDQDDGSSPDRHVAPLAESDVVSSRVKSDALEQDRHMVVLDIDHQAWLIKSSTPGHYHLYIDVPGGIPTREYITMVLSMARAGVVESGYAQASAARGFTSVRLPWKRKPGAVRW